MTKIKICGLKRIEDIEAVNQAKPDYIGFVFAKSKRQVDRKQAAELKKALDPSIPAVGVFVNADEKEILHLCDEKIIDFIQLHGDEDITYIESLKEKTDRPIIKAVRVRSEEDIINASGLSVDYLLLDTFHQDQYGGIGKRFDWSMIPKIEKPFFLAGGLNESNLEQAITTVQPYCVDVSSGAETDGLKDAEKISRIVDLVRRTDK